MTTETTKNARDEPQREIQVCSSGGKPINPITGECACCSD